MYKKKYYKKDKVRKLYRAKKRIKKWLINALYRIEENERKEKIKQELKELKKEYNKNKREIIKKVKEELNYLDLNLFLFWNQKYNQEEKKESAFDYFYGKWLLNKATTIDFWWVKISKKYFDDIIK